MGISLFAYILNSLLSESQNEEVRNEMSTQHTLRDHAQAGSCQQTSRPVICHISSDQRGDATRFGRVPLVVMISGKLCPKLLVTNCTCTTAGMVSSDAWMLASSDT